MYVDGHRMSMRKHTLSFTAAKVSFLPEPPITKSQDLARLKKKEALISPVRLAIEGAPLKPHGAGLHGFSLCSDFLAMSMHARLLELPAVPTSAILPSAMLAFGTCGAEPPA